MMESQMPSTSTPQDGVDILDYYYLSTADDPGDDALAPSVEWIEDPHRDGEHGAPIVSRAPSGAPTAPKPHVTLRMPTSSDNRECAIVKRAPSRSLTTSMDTPSSELSGNAFLYIPTEFEWRLINAMDWGSESVQGDRALFADSSDRLEPLRASAPLLRRKAHIRRASEPMSSKRDYQPPLNLSPSTRFFDDDELNIAPELEIDSPQLSPISPPFKFPGTPSDSSPIVEYGKRIFVQLLGASGLPQTGVLKRNPRPYADIAIGAQRHRTSISERRTTAPVWDSNFLFESVKDTDNVVIRVWSEGTWLGLFQCTVGGILHVQTRSNVLTFTLDPGLEPIECGSIHFRIRDLTLPLPASTPQSQAESVSRAGPSPRHQKFPSSPSIFHSPYPSFDGTSARPATPKLVLPDGEQSTYSSPSPSRSPSPSSSPEPSVDSDTRPKWVGDIIGRTLSLSRNNYPWVPTGDITIKAGPVCAGGHCDIYLGELRRDGANTKVALKQLRVFTNASANMRKMFRREVQFWSRLRHPNVLPFWGCYELDEYRLFMVSPWASNGNSLQYVQKHPEVDRRRILRQTAEALAYLHCGADGQALVHGDLKADNVLISEEGDALLADFGLTRYVEKITSISRTPSGISAHGHIRFSAPELLCPPSGEDPRPTPESDVFAFACFVIQLYSEEMPFSDIKHDVQVLTEIVRGSKPSRPLGAARDRGFDDELWTLANECWRFLAILRPSMAQVADRLRRRR